MCLKNSENQVPFKKQPKDEFITEPADFQTAIAATNFGKFNIILLLICVPSTWVGQFETNIISFIIPAAACDLNLTSSQKGLLNSSSIVGMILSGCFWGYLLDTLGRRKMIVLGSNLEFVLVVITSFAQNLQQLLYLKFIGGLITGGLYIALNTYLQEFHATKYRGKVQMTFASMYCLANILIPLMASLFLPLNFHIRIFDIIDYHGWNLFILVSSFTAAVCSICFYFLPESPKFLMSSGKNEEAIKILQKVFSMNTGRSEAEYPIFKLIEEKKEVEKDEETPCLKGYFKSAWAQISPLFGKTYFPKLVLVALVQSTFQMCMNCLRMYLPQIFQATHDFQVKTNSSSPELCFVLEELRHKSSEDGDEILCSVNLDNNFRVYLQSMVIALATMGAYGLGGAVVNDFGKKKLLNILGFVAAASMGSLYFSQNPITTTTLSAIYLSADTVCYDIMVTIVLVLFPTTLRALAFSLTIILGRSLTVLGNMVLPLLVEAGCGPPFAVLAGATLFALLLSWLIPNTDDTDIK